MRWVSSGGCACKAFPEGVAVEVRIGVTEPGCMMGASFALKARERLERLAGVVSVDVQRDHDADWDPTDLEPDYAKRLAAVRAKRSRASGRQLAPGTEAVPSSGLRNLLTRLVKGAGLSTWAKCELFSSQRRSEPGMSSCSFGPIAGGTIGSVRA